MPNLAGVFDMRSQPADTAELVTRLARVLRVPGVDYTSRSWHDERFAAVNLLTGIWDNLDQPVISGDIVLFLDGVVSNLRELVTGESEKPTEHAGFSPARVCFALYSQHGDNFVRNLNGQFNILIYDRHDRVVKVFNDRLAYRPFYYFCADGLALFGVEKKALFASLGNTPALDGMGVLEFLTFGHNLGDRTVFSGIDAMPQGSVLDFRNGRGHVRRYWRLAYDNRDAVPPLNEAARELGRRVCGAVSRSTRHAHRYGIFLSGGLDSRTTAGALARVHPDVVSFTFGRADDPDFKYGRQLAGELGFAHCRLSYDDVSFLDVLPRIVWRTEGAIPFNDTLSIAHHERIRENADIILNGHFGDVLTGGHLLPALFLLRDSRQLVKHIITKRSMLSLDASRSLFKPSFAEEAYSEMVRGIEHSLLAFGEPSQPLACNLWDMTVRQRRYTFSSAAVDRYVLEQVTPFTDNDVTEWMLKMPLRYLFGQRVYKRMILQTFPEIKHVPWAKTGHPIAGGFVRDMAALGRLFATRRLQRLIAPARSIAAAPNLSNFGGRKDLDVFWEALPTDMLDIGAVRSAARAALEGAGSTTALFLLLTLAACIRLFRSADLTKGPPETLTLF